MEVIDSSNPITTIDYMCITSVTEYNKSLRLLLKWIEVPYTIFQAHVTYVTPKIALNIQANVSDKPCLHLSKVLTDQS